MKTKEMSPCKKYELAITNYVMGEEMPVSKEELFEHLRNCSKCRADLVGWQDMYAAWRTEGTLPPTEVKKKVEALLTKVNQPSLPRRQAGLPSLPVIEPLPGEKVLDNEAEIGSVAGKLWHYLAQNGKVKMNEIRHKVKLPNTKVALALGWLAKENKVCLTKKRKATFVYLAPEEIQKHQAQGQV